MSVGHLTLFLKAHPLGRDCCECCHHMLGKNGKAVLPQPFEQAAHHFLG